MVDISVIVPIYNAENYIERCIDSVINQTKKELEIILINDGSTDNTENLIRKYKDKRIRYFKNKNQGIGKTRNFGIEKSTGKYIMFLDSDDYLNLNACKVIYEKAESNNLDLVVCDYYKVINTRKEKKAINNFKNTTLKDSPSLILDINLAPWNKLYRTNLIKDNNIKFVEDLKYEDAPFVCESIDKASKIGKINKALYYYVIHDKSETTVRDEKVFDIIRIVDKIRTYFKDKSYTQKVVDILTVKILTNYNIQQRYQKDKKLAIKFIDESFLYMKKEISNYKNCEYFKDELSIKKIIEKSKLLTKIYCILYRSN